MFLFSGIETESRRLWGYSEYKCLKIVDIVSLQNRLQPSVFKEMMDTFVFSMCKYLNKH